MYFYSHYAVEESVAMRLVTHKANEWLNGNLNPDRSSLILQIGYVILYYKPERLWTSMQDLPLQSRICFSLLQARLNSPLGPWGQSPGPLASGCFRGKHEKNCEATLNAFCSNKGLSSFIINLGSSNRFEKLEDMSFVKIKKSFM